jgi:4-amino-4-deoxy-L-arabinose transferase-like glycosyltransferase
MAVFGQSIFGLRILAAVMGALAIPALYLLARSLSNEAIAILSAAILAVMSVDIHFSRIAVNNASSPFLACIAFWLVHRAVITKRSFWFAAAGLIAGLAVYSFVGTRLVAILTGLYLIDALLPENSQDRMAQDSGSDCWRTAVCR